MATIAVPLAFAILGLLVFALSKNPQVNRAGEITFFVGMFWLCAQLSGHTFHF